jgi:ABC-type transport system involved in multi-copper enzyme maturation permease subunit
MRADLYRLARGKAVYATFASLLALVAITALNGSVFVMTASSAGDLSQKPGQPGGMAMNSEVFVLLILPLVIAVVAPLFANGTLKNSLSKGMPRSAAYMSRLALGVVFSFLLILAFAALLLACVIAKGISLTAEQAFFLAKSLLMTLFFVSVFSGLATFLSFFLQKSSRAIGAYLAAVVLPSNIIRMVGSRFEALEKLADFELMEMLGKYASFAPMPAASYIKGLAVGIAYFLAFAACGLILFKRAEVY